MFGTSRRSINKSGYLASSHYDVAFTMEAGAVALWLVDSIRLNRYFPSDHILIGLNSDPDLAARHHAYIEWWNRVRDASPSDRTRVEPAGIGVDYVDWSR